MTADTDELLPRTSRRILKGIDQQLHRGLQLYVSLRGRVLVDRAWGQSHEHVPLTRQTLLIWLSAGKPLTAVALLRLVEEGRISLDTPVAVVIPEFSQGGKAAVTVQQLLTHSVGLQDGISGWPNDTWDEIIARICRTPQREGWDHRQQGAYDPARTWFILGELIRRLDGRPVADVVRDDVMRPIGMQDSWMRMPPEIHAAYEDRIGRMHRAQGGTLRETHGHTAALCEAPSPGVSCRGPIRDLGYFYEMLLLGGERHGARLLSAKMVANQTARHREGIYDQTLGGRVDFGLGVIINSRHYGANAVPYGFGPHCSPRTFGHAGARTSIAFADPACGLVVAAAANGAQPEPVNSRRFEQLSAAIYEDLGLSL